MVHLTNFIIKRTGIKDKDLELYLESSCNFKEIGKDKLLEIAKRLKITTLDKFI